LIIFLFHTLNIINPYHKNNGYLLYFQEDIRYFLSLKEMPKDNEKG